MAIATGIAKKLAFKKETTAGSFPGVTTGAQYLRRVTSDLNLVKDTFQSNEIRTDYQIGDFRHGARKVEGSINGELACRSYQNLMAAALRASQTWTVAKTTGAQTNITAAVTVSPEGTFTRAAGSYITDGFRIGDILRWTGWATTGVNNNARNFLVTNLTATVMTGIFLDGTAVAAKASGDSVTATGYKSIIVPTTGHADDSFSIEHWHSDISISEAFLGCKVNSCQIALPASGLATINFGFMGMNILTGAAQAYTSPTSVENSTGILAAVNGALYVGTTKVATVTAMNINIAGGMSSTPVVGTNAVPAIFPGRVNVTGDISAYFETGTMRDLFINETKTTLVMALAEGSGATDNVMCITIPQVKFGGSSKNDGEAGIVQQMPFQAIVAASVTGHDDTTIRIVDVAAT